MKDKGLPHKKPWKTYIDIWSRMAYIALLCLSLFRLTIAIFTEIVGLRPFSIPPSGLYNPPLPPPEACARGLSRDRPTPFQPVPVSVLCSLDFATQTVRYTGLNDLCHQECGTGPPGKTVREPRALVECT